MKLFVKGILSFIVLLPFFCFSQNLIDTDLNEWELGQGATASFSEFGGNNERVTVAGPFGSQVTVWRASSMATTTNSGASGGWIHKGVNINTSKTYRIAYWMKSTGSTICNNNAAFYTVPTEGGSNVSPLLIGTNLERYWPSVYNLELPTDKWVLIVGYVYGKNVTTYDLPSGVFDPITFNPNSPSPILSTNNHKFPANYTALNLRLRNSLWNCMQGEIQYSYLPRIEEINGQEPTIQELLGAANNSDTQSPTVATLSSPSKTANSVSLSWSGATDNVGVSGYKVFRNT